MLNSSSSISSRIRNWEFCCEGDFHAQFNNSATCTPGQNKQLAECFLAKSQKIILFETLNVPPPPRNKCWDYLWESKGFRALQQHFFILPYVHFLLGELCKCGKFFFFFREDENKRSTPTVSGLQLFRFKSQPCRNSST